MPYRTHAELLVKEPAREHVFSNWWRKVTFRDKFLRKPKPIEEDEPQDQPSHRERLSQIAKENAARIKAAEEKAKREAIENRSQYIAEYAMLWARHFVGQAELAAALGKTQYACEIILYKGSDDARQAQEFLKKLGILGTFISKISPSLWTELRQAIISKMTGPEYCFKFDQTQEPSSHRPTGRLLTFKWVE